MKPAGVIFLLFGVSVFAQEPVKTEDREREKARATRAHELARKGVEQFSLSLGTDGKSPLKLEPEPVLYSSNPVIGSVYGATFLWTRHGRPEALTSVYKWYTPARHLGIEFHSLALDRLTGSSQGSEVWTPNRAGIELKPLLDAPAPADSTSARLRQMREISARFSADETNESNVTREIRLLAKPVLRYQVENNEPLDGGLFVFVQGTDPELVLLLEARKTTNGKFEWKYALARVTYMALNVSYQHRKVWDAPLVPWWGSNPKIADHNEPYTEFAYQPGQGVNPTEDP